MNIIFTYESAKKKISLHLQLLNDFGILENTPNIGQWAHERDGCAIAAYNGMNVFNLYNYYIS